MGFVERSTDGPDTVVVLRYAAAFYWLMWPVLAVTAWASMDASASRTVAASIAWALLLLVAAPYWPVVLEVRRQMQRKGVVASGAKYSFTNPLTYRWPNDSVHS